MKAIIFDNTLEISAKVGTYTIFFAASIKYFGISFDIWNKNNNSIFK